MTPAVVFHCQCMIAVYCRKNFSFAVHIPPFNKTLKPEFWSFLRSQSQLGDGKTFLVDASGTILSAIHIQEKKKHDSTTMSTDSMYKPSDLRRIQLLIRMDIYRIPSTLALPF